VQQSVEQSRAALAAPNRVCGAGSISSRDEEGEAGLDRL